MIGLQSEGISCLARKSWTGVGGPIAGRANIKARQFGVAARNGSPRRKSSLQKKCRAIAAKNRKGITRTKVSKTAGIMRGRRILLPKD
jgi:hypothetical protein